MFFDVAYKFMKCSCVANYNEFCVGCIILDFQNRPNKNLKEFMLKYFKTTLFMVCIVMYTAQYLLLTIRSLKKKMELFTYCTRWNEQLDDSKTNT